ncbi:MAG: hypothetical protein M3Q69_06710 [Acidobacteriota bacterium]|nr:hypothetical protein [Acidobacteriota bacterium]
MNRNFVEMLSELSDEGAEFLVIGAHAVAAHGYIRGTRDLDVWIRPTRDNAERVFRALVRFGAPLRDVTVEDLYAPERIYQLGVEPYRIDFITTPTGLDFAEAWSSRVAIRVNGREFPFVSKADLIRAKRATARPQDLVDADMLEKRQ